MFNFEPQHSDPEQANSGEYTERDSAKDEVVVFIFIFATVGLLLYAAIRPWVEKWMAVRSLRSFPILSSLTNARTLRKEEHMRLYLLLRLKNRNSLFGSILT